MIVFLPLGQQCKPKKEDILRWVEDILFQVKNEDMSSFWRPSGNPTWNVVQAHLVFLSLSADETEETTDRLRKEVSCNYSSFHKSALKH